MSGNGMHTAPNPGPPIAKVHDISFEKDKTLMRTISTEGAGTEAREGAVVTIHLTISQPGEDGELYEIYDSMDFDALMERGRQTAFSHRPIVGRPDK